MRFFLLFSFFWLALFASEKKPLFYSSESEDTILQGKSSISETNLSTTSQVSKGGNTVISSFDKAKKTLLKQVYSHRQRTIYCDCPYSVSESDKTSVNLPACGYKPKGSGLRAGRIEWEHVVPAHSLAIKKFNNTWENGHELCKRANGTKYKGRECVDKIHPEFRFMQSDMHNLYASVGEINGYRVDKPMGIIEGEKREFGKCDAEINKNYFEPSENIRGEIARTYLYMEMSYPEYFEIGSQKEMFKSWSQSDPADEWECQRNELIFAIQKNKNPLVEESCKKLNTDSFTSTPQTSSTVLPNTDGIESGIQP